MSKIEKAFSKIINLIESMSDNQEAHRLQINELKARVAMLEQSSNKDVVSGNPPVITITTDDSHPIMPEPYYYSTRNSIGYALDKWCPKCGCMYSSRVNHICASSVGPATCSTN